MDTRRDARRFSCVTTQTGSAKEGLGSTRCKGGGRAASGTWQRLDPEPLELLAGGAVEGKIVLEDSTG